MNQVQQAKSNIETFWPTLDDMDPVFCTDAELKVLYFNSAAQGLFGYSSAEVLGRPATAFLPARCRGLFSETVAELLSSGKSNGRKTLELQALKNDGTEFSAALSLCVLSLDGDTVVVALIRDAAARVKPGYAAQNEKAYHNLIENLPLPIMVIDTDLKVVAANQRMANLFGFALGRVINRNFKDLLAPKDRSRVASDLGKTFESGQARDFEYEMWTANGTAFRMKLSISVLVSEDGRPSEILAVAGDSTHRDHAQQSTANLLWFQRIITETAHIVQSIIRFQDPFIADHQERVAKLAVAIAEEMGLGKDIIEGVYVAANFHDIGKFFVPSQILSRPSKLTAAEFTIVQKHVLPAHDILNYIKFPWPVAKAVLQHHERLDGSGYPAGTKGAEIIIEARILAVADVVEAIASQRPYRAGLGIGTALDEISQKNAARYDPAVAAACVKLFKEKDFRFDT